MALSHWWICPQRQWSLHLTREQQNLILIFLEDRTIVPWWVIWHWYIIIFKLNSSAPLFNFIHGYVIFGDLKGKRGSYEVSFSGVSIKVYPIGIRTYADAYMGILGFGLMEKKVSIRSIWIYLLERNYKDSSMGGMGIEALLTVSCYRPSIVSIKLMGITNPTTFFP